MFPNGKFNTDMPSELFDRPCQLLAELIIGRSSRNIVELLREIAPSIGLKHIAYLRLAANRSADVALLTSLVTYSQEWQIRYFRRRYHEIDPLYAACLTAEAPFDWRPFRMSSQSSAFFADARDHGVGANGVTIPIRNKPNEFGLVSFTSDLADDDWEAFGSLTMPKLSVIACLIDSAATRHAKLASKQVDLSKREHQALTWAARGHTTAEIAEIMNVSYTSVRTYIETARRKLGCGNVTHAVASALATGLLSPLSLKGFDPSGYTGRSGEEQKVA